MELTGEQLISAPRYKVWEGLMDVELLRAALPGCESVTEVGEGAYSAVVVASVGPLRARFKGRLQQQDMAPPEKYGLRFEGEGGIAGFAKGSALVTLQEAGESGEHTQLSYRAEVQIGGRLAQIGSRLIDATAKRMSSQFFDRFEELLSTPVQARPAMQTPASPEAAPRVVGPSTGAVVQPFAQPGGQFTLQMPAWTWALTVAVLAALAAWLGTH
jgi:uncharacterized protein